MPLPVQLHVLHAKGYPTQRLSVRIHKQYYMLAFVSDKTILDVARSISVNPEMSLFLSDDETLLKIEKQYSPDWEWITETVLTADVTESIAIPYKCVENTSDYLMYQIYLV